MFQGGDCHGAGRSGGSRGWRGGTEGQQGLRTCDPLWEMGEYGSRGSHGFSLGIWETVVPSLSQRIQQEIVSSKRGCPGEG